MGADDKFEHNTEDAKGNIKEGAGRLTGDEDLEREGKADQTKAKLKKAGENVKDAFSS